MGKILVSLIVVSAVAAGALMYYLQVYAFYDEIPATGEGDVVLTTLAGAPEPILAEDFRAIDAASSPLRYRACFTTPMSEALLTETYTTYDDPVPLTGPGWFDCYDAAAVGAALEAGGATAYLGTFNITYGFDRVVAIFPGGQGVVWHQINRCGEEVFDGNPPPAGCPPPPEPGE
jgi:hypothetical protein